MLILAEAAPPSPASVGNLVLILGTLVQILVGICVAIGTFRRTPPADQHFATKEELGELKGEVRGSLSNLRTEIKNDFRDLGLKVDDMGKDLSAQSERRATAYHERINELDSRLSRAEATIQSEQHRRA